jgi:hypothetical protein
MMNILLCLKLPSSLSRAFCLGGFLVWLFLPSGWNPPKRLPLFIAVSVRSPPVFQACLKSSKEQTAGPVPENSLHAATLVRLSVPLLSVPNYMSPSSFSSHTLPVRVQEGKGSDFRSFVWISRALKIHDCHLVVTMVCHLELAVG